MAEAADEIERLRRLVGYMDQFAESLYAALPPDVRANMQDAKR